MKLKTEIIILISKNPWTVSSASANRWLTLIEGVQTQGASIKLFIYGGYADEAEQNHWKEKGTYKGITYNYVFPVLIQGYWKIRFYNYLGHYLRENNLITKLSALLRQSHGIIWTDVNSVSFKLAVQLKKLNSSIKTFIEMSEFLDIHHNNKGNFLQRWQGDAKQRLFEKKAFFAYDGMALMTKTLLNHYQNFPQPQPKFLHLPMTVDLERFDQPKEPLKEFHSPYLAFVGVMNDAKDGVSILIKAFNSIYHKFPNYKVYLVGGWNYDTPIHQQLIKEFELENRVFWMKEYPRDLIPNIICNADLLVLPRPDSKQAQGGFPTKLGEYLGTGNPVCATRVGEIPDYLTDNESVFFAEPGSVESFAEAMDRALSNPENAKRVGANGRKVAEREFNKDLQARKLVEFLEELVSQEPSSTRQKIKGKR